MYDYENLVYSDKLALSARDLLHQIQKLHMEFREGRSLWCAPCLTHCQEKGSHLNGARARFGKYICSERGIKWGNIQHPCSRWRLIVLPMNRSGLAAMWLYGFAYIQRFRVKICPRANILHMIYIKMQHTCTHTYIHYTRQARCLINLVLCFSILIICSSYLAKILSECSISWARVSENRPWSFCEFAISWHPSPISLDSLLSLHRRS